MAIVLICMGSENRGKQNVQGTGSLTRDCFYINLKKKKREPLKGRQIQNGTVLESARYPQHNSVGFEGFQCCSLELC